MNLCNQITLIGRITKDVEIKMTTTGKQVWGFTIALNKIDKGGERQSTFIPCKTFSPYIINFADKYMGKGDMVALNGELRIDKYTDKNGKQATATYVLVDSLERLLGKKRTQSNGDDELLGQEPQEVESRGNKGFSTAPTSDVTDDDLPF